MKGQDWQRFVFDPAGRWVGRLMRLAERRFPDPAVAGAAYNVAFEKISGNDWHLLDCYAGTAQPGTYLTAVFCRLLEDYSRARFGRPRPPAWLSRLGESWKRVYQLLCLERIAPEAIVDRLTVRDARPQSEVRRTIAEIRARVPDCGQSRGEIATADPAETLAAADHESSTPESELSQRELADLLGALRCLLDPAAAASAADPGGRADALASALRPRLAQLRGALDLDDEERLILKLLYQDGRTVAAAARALRLPEHQVRRRRERAVSRLRQALLGAGIGPELLSNE